MRRTKDHILFLLLLVAGLLTGCTADDIQMDSDSNEIRFKVTEWQSMSGTRANTMTESTLISNGSFQIDAFMGTSDTKFFDEHTVTYDAGEWQLGGKYYWPQGNLTFVAYSPTVLPGTTYITKSTSTYYTYDDGPSFVCTSLPMTTAEQENLSEFVYAVAKDQNKSTQGATGVNLAFRHPLAKLMLQVRNSHRKLTINKITFKNLYNNGTLTHATNTSVWSTTGSRTDLVIVPDPIEDIEVNTTTIANIATPLLVLPQDYTAYMASQIEVKLQYWKMDDSGKEDELTIFFNNPIGKWEIGKSYTYTLDLSEKVRFGVRITDWGDDGIADMINFSYDTNFMLNVDNWDNDGVGDAVSFSYDADFRVDVENWENDGTDNLDYDN